MSAVDTIGPAPETRAPRFLWLLLGASVAPLFWLGQVMLGYGVTAYICYPGDHPQGLTSAEPLSMLLIGCDAVALLACVGGAAISWRAWHRRAENGGAFTARTRVSRSRFLALWGLMSSLWFFFAIMFNVIASVTVPPCVG